MNGFEPIQGQPGYHVSRDGIIWSDHSERQLSGSKAGLGYRFIQFPDGSREYIHRIVCRTFNGAPTPDRPEVRHLDGNKENNSATNLAWGTKAENELDKFLHGTTPKGERNPMARLSIAMVREMRAIRKETGSSYAVIAKEFGVSVMTAFRAVSGQSWKECEA